MLHSMPNVKTEPKGLLIKIRGMRSSLKSAELKVADFILERPDSVQTSTVANIAASSDVSEATVIRTCRTLGFDGFQGLKFQLAKELYQPTVSLVQEEIKDSDTAEGIMQKVFSFNVNTLKETVEILDPASLEKAADILGNARKVLIVGVGTSSANVQDAHNKLFRLGIESVAQSDAHLQLMEASLLTPEDAVLAISHSGRTTDPIQTLETTKKTGAKTIVITSNPKSPITEHADVVLLTSSSENRFRSEALASRLAQMSIVDVLHTLITRKFKKRALGATKKIEAVIGQKQIWEKR